jgi:hypothetical protein
MNLFYQPTARLGCVKHCGEEIVCGSSPLMIEQRFFCLGSYDQTSSTTKQDAYNYQAALQTAGQAPGVVVGAGGTSGAITQSTTTDSGNTVVSGDTLTAALALSLANNAITNDQASGIAINGQNAALAGHSIDAQTELAAAAIQAASDQAGQSIVAAEGQADRVADLATTSMELSTNLGGAAINLAGGVVNEAFNFAQNESVLNYNALNQNTALAFSTIAALSTAQASGAISAEAADLARIAGQIGTQSGGTTTVVVPAASTQPYTAVDTSSGGVSAGTLTMIGIVLAALYFLFPKGAKQLTG